MFSGNIIIKGQIYGFNNLMEVFLFKFCFLLNLEFQNFYSGCSLRKLFLSHTFLSASLLLLELFDHLIVFLSSTTTFEPGHYKTSKVNVRPAKTQISLAIRPV